MMFCSITFYINRDIIAVQETCFTCIWLFISDNSYAILTCFQFNHGFEHFKRNAGKILIVHCTNAAVLFPESIRTQHKTANVIALAPDKQLPAHFMKAVSDVAGSVCRKSVKILWPHTFCCFFSFAHQTDAFSFFLHEILIDWLDESAFKKNAFTRIWNNSHCVVYTKVNCSCMFTALYRSSFYLIDK